jgi:ribosomal subunit interface protein
MSFPQITFKHTQTPVVYHLQDLITQKFQSLERYVGGKTDARCEVEFAKVAPHKNGAIYRTEVNLFIDGTLYRVEATEESFEKAIDSVRSELDTELGRARTKRVSLFRQGARKMKDMMRTGS